MEALVGQGRPSWLTMAHMRSNSMGHTIRISFLIRDEERARIASAISARLHETVRCGDGVLSFTMLRSVFQGPPMQA